MLPALDNYIAYGSETMVQHPAYLRAVISMVEDIFGDEKGGGVDRICGCKLAETVMLNLRGYIDQYIPLFIELAMNVIDSGDSRTKSYRIHLIEMVINTIYYNPLLSLQYMESKGWTNKFFSAWFSNIDNFKRVHDKKLSIVAISSLLTLKAEEVPVSVQQGWPRLLQGVTRLFQTLPAAMRSESCLIPDGLYIYFLTQLSFFLSQTGKSQRKNPIMCMMMMMTTTMTMKLTGTVKSSGPTKMSSRGLGTGTLPMRVPLTSTS